MSAESQWAVQQAVKAKLDAATALTAITSTRIYDHVPQDTIYPYVVLGEMNATPMDTMTFTGMQIFLNVYCWSRNRGRREIRQMMEKIYEALNRQALTITGQHHIDTLFVSSSTSQDSDGLTYYGQQTFLIRTEPTT